MQLDALDWKIIDILREANVPNSSIARELDLSEGAIRQRLKKLKDSGVMIVRGLINPDILENQQIAMVAATVAESSFLETKAREIAELLNVQSVNITTGRYDLMIEVLVDSNKGLVKFLTEELSKVHGIASTESFIMLKGYNKYI
ncbi:MAG: Lrp/AsnC family transcriptional regulator [Spirochaetales bacterium]|uniref:Lrp/AsnC family transcriptional regulator n=1 Tax=Candidatus Thalassospirochaeta sargassi TaxID=3119039 RepID=A0AAJ1ILM4_9SPIO|nr:Lrp/AsnC family transcriptional regulator [Spirochaetales bacterium]